jgi:hypothetical protein
MQGRDDRGKGDPRGDRLKAALRENLKRRKAQARSRQDIARPPTDAPPDDGGETR